MTANAPFLAVLLGLIEVLRLQVDDLGHRVELSRVGKKKAGRELDGRTWDEFPKAVAS
ncbi:hypothetical protein [Streptomyces sp. HC307]|uniref:hypothetical protein n=1 Tax=Streptomyces flavusporus TaxID=3385496 RepID=UPI00391708F5